jgi:hypothetical protein
MDEYGIFKGIPQMRPFQLGLVSDLQRATDLMNRMYARIPGNYFIRDMVTREVVASLPCANEDLPGGTSSSAKEPPFDIFCGVPDKNAAWYESVEGLSNARARMEQIARIRPGKYFVFSRRDHSVLAQVETFTDTQFPIAPSSAA